MKTALVGALLCGASVVGVSVGSASADGPPNHNHYLSVNGTLVQVGPHVCDHPDVLHDAFHNFHANVHRGAPTDKGNLAITAVLCAP